jgi:hypothetical protein
VSSAGYSPAPLLQKLGIKAGQRAAFINAPQHYGELLGPLPEGISFPARAETEGSLDFVHIFCFQRSELSEQLARYKSSIFPAGVIWVSWPKKNAVKRLGINSDITEDSIRDIALPLGLVDVKVCAVDEIWSGLKLVWRTELRG